MTVPSEVRRRLAGPGGGVQIRRDALCRLDAQTVPVVGLADRDVAGRQVREHRRAGQCVYVLGGIGVQTSSQISTCSAKPGDVASPRTAGRCRTARLRRGVGPCRRGLRRGGELPLLVELAVVGQVGLRHDAEDLPAVTRRAQLNSRRRARSGSPTTSTGVQSAAGIDDAARAPRATRRAARPGGTGPRSNTRESPNSGNSASTAWSRAARRASSMVAVAFSAGGGDFDSRVATATARTRADRWNRTAGAAGRGRLGRRDAGRACKALMARSPEFGLGTRPGKAGEVRCTARKRLLRLKPVSSVETRSRPRSALLARLHKPDGEQSQITWIYSAKPGFTGGLLPPPAPLPDPPPEKRRQVLPVITIAPRAGSSSSRVPLRTVALRR